MRIIAQKANDALPSMTLYAQWYSTDGKKALRMEDGCEPEVVNLEEEGYKLMVVDDDFFEHEEGE